MQKEVSRYLRIGIIMKNGSVEMAMVFRGIIRNVASANYGKLITTEKMIRRYKRFPSGKKLTHLLILKAFTDAN